MTKMATKKPPVMARTKSSARFHSGSDTLSIKIRILVPMTVRSRAAVTAKSGTAIATASQNQGLESVSEIGRAGVAMSNDVNHLTCASAGVDHTINVAIARMQ